MSAPAFERAGGVDRWKNKGTEDLFDGVNSRQARRLLPRGLLRIAQRKLSLGAAAATLDALRVPHRIISRLSGDALSTKKNTAQHRARAEIRTGIFTVFCTRTEGRQSFVAASEPAQILGSA